MTATKQTDKQGATQLIRNNQVLNCPYQPAQVIPGQLAGQINIIRLPCNSHCPFFLDYGNTVKLACKEMIINIESDKPNLNLVP